MGNAKFVGRIGALAVALGVGCAVVAPAVTSADAPGPIPPCVSTSAACALILGGTTIPTPDDHMVEVIKNQYIAPTYPGKDIGYAKVTAPQEFWPLTGFARILGLLAPPDIFGLGGPAWPDVPLWKLSGLFDLTPGQSIQAGLVNLEAAMDAHGNDHLVIFGVSQGAVIANLAKQRLADQYPDGDGPDVEFVLLADLNLPNGGLFARFPGVHIPIIDLPLNGPAPTNTQFKTVSINQRYDGFTDFPLYPLNLVADLNAVLGVVYVHTYALDLSLAGDPSAAYQGHYGDTDYYVFDSPNLPLFGPLRTLGVPEPLIDVVEPFFREVVELGYDRTIDPWMPTPARLIPHHDPATVAGDLLDAVREGLHNAAALFGAPAPVGADELSVSVGRDAKAGQLSPTPNTPVVSIGRGEGGDVPEGLPAVAAEPAQQTSVTRDDLQPVRHKVSRQLAAVQDQLDKAFTSAKSLTPERKTPLRDAFKKAGHDVNKAVAKVSRDIKKALRRGNDDKS